MGENSSEQALVSRTSLVEGNRLGAMPADVPRLLVETGSPFRDRDSKFGGEYTQPRAVAAFRDYLRLRDTESSRNKSQSSLQRRGQAPREKTDGPRILGGEVLLLCQDSEEAMRRVLELIGPVPTDMRVLTYYRLGDKFKSLREENRPTPVSGFATVIPAWTATGQEGPTWNKSWRLDYGSPAGCHFNVVVRPPIIDQSSQIGHYKTNHEKALNIAFTFPGGPDAYEGMIDALYDQSIVSMYEDGALNYLPVTL